MYSGPLLHSGSFSDYTPLGEVGYPMGGIGLDFAPYSAWMKKQGMSEKYLVSIPEEHCAQAFITTDLDSNQITAFHPGAMQSAHLTPVPPAEDPRDVARELSEEVLPGEIYGVPVEAR